MVIDEFVLAPRDSPTGSEPLPSDQEYGGTPPVAAQIAVYAVPAVVGPPVGAQLRLSGMAPALATVRLAALEAGPSEAVMGVVPGDKPVAFPAAVMVATPGVDDAQLT